MVLAVRRGAANEPLAALVATFRDIGVRHGSGPVGGLVPGLIVTSPTGWTPATELISGHRLPDLLDAAKQRWRGQPHATAALAWKAYCYWAALPAVIGYAATRRVPLPRPANVLVRYSDRRPLLTLALYRPVVAVLASDPFAATGRPDIVVCDDDGALLAQLRRALVDEHLEPIITQLRQHAHLGRRTLWGSLASGVAHALINAADSVPGSIRDTIDDVLHALDATGLVDVAADPETGEVDVQRRTCCLAFTLPEPKICAGCCIRR